MFAQLARRSRRLIVDDARHRHQRSAVVKYARARNETADAVARAPQRICNAHGRIRVECRLFDGTQTKKPDAQSNRRHAQKVGVFARSTTTTMEPTGGQRGRRQVSDKCAHWRVITAVLGCQVRCTNVSAGAGVRAFRGKHRYSDEPCVRACRHTCVPSRSRRIICYARQ